MIQTFKHFLAGLALATATALTAPAPAFAQVASTDLFKPVVVINGKAVTNFEHQQRIMMMKLFRSPGDLEKEALEALIDDRLRFLAADEMGLALTDEQIVEGETEFAGRANLSREQFIQALEGAGVARESYRDFVAAGLLWRQVVATRFAPLAQAQVTETDIQHAIAATSRRGGGVKVDFAEIILPANTPAAAAQAERIAAELGGTNMSDAAFSSAARRYSASPSRARGGRVPEPVPLGNLPGQIAQAFLTLPPGGVTEPFPIPNAIAIFQLRRMIDSADPGEETVALEYARFLIPGGRTEDTLAQAAKIRTRVDSCNDLYGIAKGLPANRLTRETMAAGDVPGDIAIELAKLDPGESSTALTSGNALVFLMLCGRTTATLADDSAAGTSGVAPRQSDGRADTDDEDQARASEAAAAASAEEDPAPTAVEGVPEVRRAAVRQQLINQIVASYAESYLAELKANAIITYP
ncbi:peptidyl-prolyl cis-trans isomerase SurA [Vannielia litorea]|uniref:peptidylprolyl isomerase n=1 Tax=Vannielia litorea TaxID=1217970 RepID=UPI001C9470B8|nr:peptidylprolyl isomerase [Vannielia litorea]MBY6152355.1 peptidyl-prolyl cis-trans isomerase SurA [Vannielia litorea]